MMSGICNFSSSRLMFACLVFYCGLAGAGSTVYVVDSGGQNHYFDTTTNFWLLGQSYISAYIPAYVAITPDGAFSYTTSIGNDAVIVHNLAHVPPTQVTVIPVGGAAIGIDINPSGTRAYVAVENIGKVAVIDTATNTVITSVATGDKPIGVEVTPNGQQVWVGHRRSGVVHVIDAVTNTLLTGLSYPILSGPGPAEIAFTPDGNFAYVTNSGFDDVTAIDADSVTVIDTSIPGGIKVIGVGNKPLGIAMTPDGKYAYVANSGSIPGNPIHAVSVIATGGSTCAEPLEIPPCVLTTIPVGDNLQDVAITEDGLFAYVSNRNSKNVTVISTATNTVAATVSIIAASNLAGIAIAPPPDADNDGVPDDTDNCKNIPNPGQENHDGDTQGDVCDADDDNDGQTDVDENTCGSNSKDISDLSPDFDGDDSPDCVDLDDDNDGQSDDDEIACNSSPKDINDLSPDNDNDNSPDCVDPDDDNDGVNDDVPDNCPFDRNPMQTDSNSNDVGDVCDPELAGNAEIMATVGGDVMTGNGDVSLVFDPDDLSADTEIGVSAVETPLSVNLGVSLLRAAGTDSPSRNPVQDGGAPQVFDLGTVLVAYNFTPGGLQFNSDVSLTMSFDVSALNEAQREAVDIYSRVTNTRYSPLGADCPVTQEPVGTFTVTCTVEITRFVILALVAPRDRDRDGAFDRFVGIEDNCLNIFNPDQRDIFGNGIGDLCDPEYIHYDGFEGGGDN